MRMGWLQVARERAADPRMVDAVLVVLGAALTYLAVKTPWSPMPAWAIAISGLAGSVALWWHRRRPVVVTGLGAVAYVLSGNPGPLVVGLHSGAATRRFRWLPLLLAVGTIGFTMPDVMEYGSVPPDSVGTAALLTAVTLAAGAYAGTRRELVASLRDRAERAEAERHLRVEQARANERARIAREMHDVLAHKISLIALHAGALEVDPAADAPRVGHAATLIGSTAREALAELRSVLGILRSDGDAADASALRDQFADIGLLVASWERAGVAIRLRDEVQRMPTAIGRAAYRLVQEGITNAHRHAPGATVEVTITGGDGDDVFVAVVNGAADGSGHADLQGAGTGLIGLGERLRLVGGTLTSGRHGAGGWKLEGRLPWPAGDEQQHETVDGSVP